MVFTGEYCPGGHYVLHGEYCQGRLKFLQIMLKETFTGGGGGGGGGLHYTRTQMHPTVTKHAVHWLVAAGVEEVYS